MGGPTLGVAQDTIKNTQMSLRHFAFLSVSSGVGNPRRAACATQSTIRIQKTIITCSADRISPCAGRNTILYLFRRRCFAVRRTKYCILHVPQMVFRRAQGEILYFNSSADGIFHRPDGETHHFTSSADSFSSCERSRSLLTTHLGNAKFSYI